MPQSKQFKASSQDTANGYLLTDERYARLVIGVDEPARTVAAIRQALARDR